MGSPIPRGVAAKESWILTTTPSRATAGNSAQLTACLGRTVGYGLRESFSKSEHALFVHFLLLVVAFLMSGAAVLAPASVSNPTTAENFLPID